MMSVKRYWCERHGPQPPKISALDGLPRCPECGWRLETVEYGAEQPPKGGGTLKWRG